MHNFGTYHKLSAEEFKSLRHSLKISQRELGEILGLSRNTIWRAETFGPSHNTVLRVEKAQLEKKL
jgi:transcriptional regulator with XRE-family HTH domain